MTARKHHYVPQCYLKLFSVSHKKIPQLTVFDRERKKMFKTGIDNVAAQRDFNTIDSEGYDPDTFEKEMSRFESELAEALQRINVARSLADEEDRAYLINLVGLTALRNPRLRETMRQAHEQTARLIMDQVLSSKETYERQMKEMKAAGRGRDLDVSYEVMKKFVRDGNFKITLNNNAQIAREIGVFDKVLPLLFERRWILLRAPSNSSGFITADHPFCLMWSDPKMRGGFYPPGLGLRKTDIYFTISPRLAMVGSFEIENGEADILEESVASVNGAIVLTAEAQVYARDHNFHYTMQPDEPPKKASKLLSDPRFIRSDVKN
jgi:Protein of unknown function (DUF4238)